MRMVTRLLLLGALLVASTVGQFIPVEECPLTPPCCEEDCCGVRTSWDSNIDYCVEDLDSNGFDGNHSDEWEEGCVMHASCGESCCFSETTWDGKISSCVSTPIAPGNQKEIGDDCESDSECFTGLCHFGNVPPGSPGICACNSSDSTGCEGELTCYAPSEIGDARGIGADFPPSCLLPVGASCKDDGSCLTANCDDTTNVCSCNTFTSFPCETDRG